MAGYRTYIIAAVLGLAAAGKYLGYLDDSLYAMILSVLAPAGLITAAIHKP